MNKTTKQLGIMLSMITLGCAGCAHGRAENVAPEDAARINRKLVRNAVSFGPGAEDGAVVPEVSSPCLRAEMVPERTETNRLIEKHREWVLDCDVRLLGIPDERRARGSRQ